MIVIAIVLLLTVYGRFFRIYMYTAIAPIPLSTLAGQPTENIARSFLKSYAGVCLQGVVIVLADGYDFGTLGDGLEVCK